MADNDQIDVRKKLEEVIYEGLCDLEKTASGDENRGAMVKEMSTLIEAMTKIDHESYEYFDKEARRDLEKEKNDALVEAENAKRELEREKLNVEREKNSITFGKALFEVGGKILLPMAIQMLAYIYLFNENLDFEKTGIRRTSWLSKELHLPKFWR